MVAMMIVVYRYYVYRRKGKEWEELEQIEEKRNARKIYLKVSKICVSFSFKIHFYSKD